MSTRYHVAMHVDRPDEIYLRASADVVPGLCAFLHRKWNGRLVNVFAEDRRAQNGKFAVYYQFALDDLHGFVFVEVEVDEQKPELLSLTNAFPSINWQEREIQDWFGLKLVGHPNARRCALHDDWPDVHPMRKDFDLRTKMPPFSGERHHFRKVEGEGVFQVPVGPVHAGIIEPGHFLFSVAGEPILYLQIRLFYTHKATEKLFENMPVEHCVRLAESVSGDSSFAHATAFCHAVERAANTEVPERARAMRCICLELERIYNHVADIGAIATDVAFVVANAHAMRLKESVLRVNEQVSGSRLLRGMACPGGVRFDWNDTQAKAICSLVDELRPDFNAMVELIEASTSTRDRLETTGVLLPQIARDLGIVGLAGRASGFNHDLRRDFPHAAYANVRVNVPSYTAGDVLHRMLVRVDEVRESFRIIETLLCSMPSGPIRAKIGDLPPDVTALGYVEGWRGEIYNWIRTLPGNRLARCRVKDPSLQNWPAMTEAVQGNIIPDFPVINKSFNLSYSGTDR
ncbi:MAG: hydrogenase large subunit [Limisphaerales bacterium]